MLLKTPTDVQGWLQLLAGLELPFCQKRLWKAPAFCCFPGFALSQHRQVLWQCRASNSPEENLGANPGSPKGCCKEHGPSSGLNSAGGLYGSLATSCYTHGLVGKCDQQGCCQTGTGRTTKWKSWVFSSFEGATITCAAILKKRNHPILMENRSQSHAFMTSPHAPCCGQGGMGLKCS